MEYQYPRTRAQKECWVWRVHPYQWSVGWVEGVLRQPVPYGPPLPLRVGATLLPLMPGPCHPRGYPVT